MISNAELIFWCMCGGLTLLSVYAMIAIANYLEYKKFEKN